jgi:SAM-dependent methyltransferase
VSDLNNDYYQHNAGTFFADTVGVDMTPLYRRFLPLLPEAAHVLDAGCGSGRDALAFAERGYRVTAFDASPALVALAESHLGRPVQCLRFQEIAWRDAFDGIWACASLLHVPAAELPDAMQRLCRALKPGGVIYASFKYGSGEREHHGRRFTDLDEPGLAALLAQVPGLDDVETWTTGDLRPGRESERWLNTLLRRFAAPTVLVGGDPVSVRHDGSSNRRGVK